MSPEQLGHLWTQAVELRSATLASWMRGIYVAVLIHDTDGVLDVRTRPLPQMPGHFHLTEWGRNEMMEALHELAPGARWVHSERL